MSTYFVGSFVVEHPDQPKKLMPWYGVSGNAKQRRKQIRQWKAQGYTVRHVGSRLNPVYR